MRVALALLAMLAVVPSAAAGENVVFTARPGEVLHWSVQLANATSISPVDATTRNSTGIGYLTQQAPQEVGSWIAVGSLKDGAVPFTIHVPRGAAPGQYFAGLVAAEGSKRQIVGIEIDVAGPLLARFVLGAVNVGRAHGRQRLYLHVSNAGNVARRPQGAISIQTRSGATLQRARFQMASFLPHTSIDYPLPLGGPLPPGAYVAVVRLTYPDASGIAAQTSSSAPEFTVSNLPRDFRPHPSSSTPTATHETPGASAWPWIAATGGGAVVLAAAVYLALALQRRRPVTVSVTPVQAPSPQAKDRCAGHHYWHVDWSSAEPGPGGTVTYTHRCRRCGLEVRASDIGDAAAQAASLP